MFGNYPSTVGVSILPEFFGALKGCIKTTLFRVNSKNESPGVEKSDDISIRICVVKCRACRIYEMYNLARKIKSVQERIKHLTAIS